MNRINPEDLIPQSTYPEYPISIRPDEVLLLFLFLIFLLFIIRIFIIRKRDKNNKMFIKTIIIYSIIFITGIIYCVITSFEQPTYNLVIIETYNNILLLLLIFYFILIIAEIFSNRKKKENVHRENKTSKF